LIYQENKPNEISFSGSYTQSRKNSSILEYECTLPEFDSKGVATRNMIKYKDSLSIETPPVQKKLPTTDISSINAHWAERELRIMFGLEAFKGGANFKPEDYMNRAEFAYALVQIAKAVPEDPALAKKTAAKTTRKTSKEVTVSPFNDVSVGSAYFTQIKEAYDRGLLSGNGLNSFRPNDSITKAEAIVAIIRALGFEKRAPAPVAVTSFKDNNSIPAYARNSAYIAQKIGLLKADSTGKMNPSKKLTKADMAVLLTDFVEYMQDGIRNDYREAIVNY
jgi:N-acetylmuramoyl-L-alanine amidase